MGNFYTLVKRLKVGGVMVVVTRTRLLRIFFLRQVVFASRLFILAEFVIQFFSLKLTFFLVFFFLFWRMITIIASRTRCLTFRDIAISSLFSCKG